MRLDNVIVAQRTLEIGEITITIPSGGSLELCADDDGVVVDQLTFTGEVIAKEVFTRRAV